MKAACSRGDRVIANIFLALAVLSVRRTVAVAVAVVVVASDLSQESSGLPETLAESAVGELREHTALSEFRLVNRRKLIQCADPSPYLQIITSSDDDHSLADEDYVTVNVTGVLAPSHGDWLAMISPSHASVEACLQSALMYEQTGDFSSLPLLCHYPVKAQYLSTDPEYLSCKKQECKNHANGECNVKTCGASLRFHVVNIRTDIEFVMFGGGFVTPCIFNRSQSLSFANPNKPLHGHISSIDSTGTSMRIRWVSGSESPQEVQYGDGKTQTSSVSTFSQDDMCTSSPVASPAVDFGWHDPGYIHSAVMTGLRPSTTYSYRYGSDPSGWSDEITFKTPPAGGSDELKFLAYGDLGKAPLDPSAEHYIQPGSISVVKAMTDEVSQGEIDSIFHIGDISYATGFLVEWDFFLHSITPIASRVSYMTAIGNHERDYVNSGSIYITPDSGGECGVVYEAYFPMPTSAKDKPWYSIEQGSVHFTVISTEHDWTVNSEQYEWMHADMAAVDRARTPWLIFTGHRPMYSSIEDGFSPIPSVDKGFVDAVEPLLLANKVDLALFGHVHNYERTCAVYKQECKAMPKKDREGIDTYNSENYSAPVYAVIGMAGFKLDGFSTRNNSWSLSRISKFGYLRVNAAKELLKVEFVNADSRNVEDSFQFTRR